VLGCAAFAFVAVVVMVFLWTRFGRFETECSPEIQQHNFIRRNLVIVAVAEILMTMPQAGIPILFATRIQRIICTDRLLPCSRAAVFPSESVITDANLYTSYLSSAVGASNFLGTLLVGSVSDIIGRRICVLVVALGLVADSVICMMCSDLQVSFQCTQLHVSCPLSIFACRCYLHWEP
jgi:hypothetical protein